MENITENGSKENFKEDYSRLQALKAQRKVIDSEMRLIYDKVCCQWEHDLFGNNQEVIIPDIHSCTPCCSPTIGEIQNLICQMLFRLHSKRDTKLLHKTYWYDDDKNIYFVQHKDYGCSPNTLFVSEHRVTKHLMETTGANRNVILQALHKIAFDKMGLGRSCEVISGCGCAFNNEWLKK